MKELPVEDLVARRTERLLRGMLLLIRAHVRDGPQSRASVYEVLAVLGTAAGVVLRGTGFDPEARDLFDRCLAQELAKAQEDPDATFN